MESQTVINSNEVPETTITLSDSEILLAVVPQRYPFLMVDRILEHEFQTRALCLKNVTLGEEIFTGHFENNPIYPGVLMVEMGLQTTQVMLTNLESVKTKLRLKKQGREESKNTKAPQGFLVMIEKFKYFTTVTPGDSLLIESKLDILAMGLAKCSVQISKQDTAGSLVRVAEGRVSVTVSQSSETTTSTEV